MTYRRPFLNTLVQPGTAQEQILCGECGTFGRIEADVLLIDGDGVTTAGRLKRCEFCDPDNQEEEWKP